MAFFNQGLKAQITPQSLMKFGVAIFAMLVVAAIAYFGLFSSTQFVKAQCKLPGGIVCEQHNLSVTSTNNRLVLSNNLGIDITINDIRIGSGGGVFQCTALDDGGSNVSPLPVYVPPGGSYVHVFGPGNDFPTNGCMISGSGAKVGDKVKGPLSVTYTNLRINVKYPLNGTIIAELEN